MTVLDPPVSTASRTTTAPSSVHPDVELVTTIASGLASVTDAWDPVPPSPDERRFRLVLATERYDAWVIHWPPGTGLDAHDHGGSVGAFVVISGALDEDRLGTDTPSERRRIVPGMAVSLDVDHVHAMTNRGDVGATSVHVYSPPLRTMRFYRPDEGGRLALERVEDL